MQATPNARGMAHHVKLYAYLRLEQRGDVPLVPAINTSLQECKRMAQCYKCNPVAYQPERTR